MLESLLEFSIVASAAESSPWWRFFGRLHPLLLHFPIAMLIAAGSVELIMSWRKEARPCSVASFCLWVGAIFAILATWTGWEMAEFEDIAANPVKADLLEWHRWTGVVLAILVMLLCLIWVFERLWARRWAFNAYRYGLWASAVLVCFVGHFGAEMKWGRDYLFSVLRPQPASMAVAVPPVSANAPNPSEVDKSTQKAGTPKSAPISWSRQIEPVLNSRCGDCHGPDAQKGGLQLVPYEAFRSHEDMIDQADPMRSLLIHRVVLPQSDPDAMPPNGDRLTDQQIQEIADWIAQGSPGPDQVAGASASDPVEASTSTTDPPARPSSSIEDQSPSSFDVPRQQDAMSSIRTMGGFVAPISRKSPWLDVNLSLIRPAVADFQIRPLEALKETVVWLNLGDTAITDEGVSRTVASLNALRRLRLDRTGITDKGVSSLANLHALEVLNLFGTKVGDGCLATIGRLPSLETVYLWDTHVTTEGLDRLRSLRPNLNVVLGRETSIDATENEVVDESQSLQSGA